MVCPGQIHHSPNNFSGFIYYSLHYWLYFAEISWQWTNMHDTSILHWPIHITLYIDLRYASVLVSNDCDIYLNSEMDPLVSLEYTVPANQEQVDI